MWLLSWAIVIVASVLLFLWRRAEKRRYKDIDKIPGPPTQLFFGNAAEFGNSIEESFDGCRRLIKKYGPLVRIWQGPFRVILLITDPDYAEYFLSSNVHIKKSDGYRLFEAWIRQGLITSTGEKWKRHRRVLTPAFHFKILEQFSANFHNAGQILIRNLKQASEVPIDIHQHIIKYALDVLCESSMRIHVDAQNKSSNEFITVSKTFMNIYAIRFYSVLKRIDFLFQFCSEYKAHKKSIDYLQNFTMEVVQRRKRERLEDVDVTPNDFGIKKKKAFLDILLDNNELTDEEVCEEVDSFMFAGHDTVTSAMSFGLFELAKHSDIQQKILDEIHDVVGTDNTREITMQHLQDMKYLDCAIKEILRIYPSVPNFERELTEDVVLDGLNIPSGTTVAFNVYMHHRNEKYFPDPEKYDPDRFLPHNVAARHKFAYIPFSAGPRNCIGFKYALGNCKTTIANVIRHFEVRPVVPDHVPKLANDSVLKSTNGLPIILRLRKYM